MFKKQAGKRGGKVNETRFSNGLSSNEEPKHQNKKESVEADPRGQMLKEKITDVDIAFSVEERRTLIKSEEFVEITVNLVSLNAFWFHVRIEQ